MFLFSKKLEKSWADILKQLFQAAVHYRKTLTTFIKQSDLMFLKAMELQKQLLYFLYALRKNRVQIVSALYFRLLKLILQKT